MRKNALVTGISGQDGSYLAELLLSKGYTVYGLKRRSSTDTLGRIKHIAKDINLIDGDLTDCGSIQKAIRISNPDEVYNLAAQSFVQTSFIQPELTSEITGLGVTRLLESIRLLKPDARFYQASSSEIYGSSPPPQHETTPFHPRSPYGVAKLYGYWMTVNYRERADSPVFACNGILYNHETIISCTPIIYKNAEGYIDIAPISEVVRYFAIESPELINESAPHYQEASVKRELFIWDHSGWTRVKFASAYPHDKANKPKAPRIINAHNAVFTATDTHKVIMDGLLEKEIKDIKIGDKLNTCSYPPVEKIYEEITAKEAYLLGVIVGDGHVSKSKSELCVTSKSAEYKEQIKNLWAELGGTSNYSRTISGFTGEDIGRVNLTGKHGWISRFNVYDKDQLTVYGDRTKRIPYQVLNGTREVMLAFLRGYNSADGLKAGYGCSEFKNFKTNSATLAAGLCYLITKTSGQAFNITVEESVEFGARSFFYSINFCSDSPKGQNHKNGPKAALEIKTLIKEGKSQREICRVTGYSRGFIRKIQNGYIPTGGHHRLKVYNTVKKIIDYPDYSGWFYDLETESGTFHCGVGLGHVHNSPRRGSEFVTQKIAQAVAAIKAGRQSKLYLGNLEAKRDWGHAKDFVEAMWLMLQQPKADDYVVGTGKAHTVRDFVEAAFKVVGLDYREYVEIDHAFYRPTEVDYLLADYSKARKVLGWKPKISFDQLVTEMVEAAINTPYDVGACTE